MVEKLLVSFIFIAFVAVIKVSAQCDPGYEDQGWWTGCADIDECLNSTACETGVECVNTPGSYKCLDGNDTSNDDHSCQPQNGTCVDGDKCLNATICAKGQVCKNVDGRYVCVSEGGRGRSGAPDGSLSSDGKDDSKTDVQPEDNGETTTATTTTTTKDASGCEPGYARGWWGSCKDIDECEENTHNCTEKQECVNKEGSFECLCAHGETSCAEEDHCASNPCDSKTSICRLTNSSFVCDCKNGYIKDNKNQCEDLDECHVDKVCSHECVNTDGSFQCHCPLGYELQSNGVNCSDINECEKWTPCEQGCRNTQGSFVCYCDADYQLTSGNRCVPEYKHVGDPNRNGSSDRIEDSSHNEIERENEDNSHVFVKPQRINDKCQVGFFFNRRTQRCEDIDECRLQLHNCDREEDCLNSVGSFVCSQCESGSVRNELGQCEKPPCYPGYIWDDAKKNCTDFDECFHIAPCGSEPCYNVDGAYFCGCYGSHCPSGEYKKGCIPGFQPSRFSIRHCVDVNECLDRSKYTCQRDEVCVNTFGGYYCQCKFGYKKDSRLRRCVDIDECKLFPAICYGTCLNTQGSYQCVGSTADRQEEEKKCNGHIDDYGRCIEDADTCRPGGECDKKEECPRGFKKNAQGVCVDIDECAENICEPDERCENTHGGYRCVRQQKCEGTECKEDNAPPVDGCGQGYFKDVFGRCVDINECETDICGDKRCVNSEGSYKCVSNTDTDDGDNGGEEGDEDEELKCDTGYEMNSQKQCVDIDECRRSRICGDKRCENTAGSFRCIDDKPVDPLECDPGYNYDRQLKKCVDVDECKVYSGICGDQKCRNYEGTYSCGNDTDTDDDKDEDDDEAKCGRGYEVNSRRQCVDIDECRQRGICGIKRCENTPGSFRCVDDEPRDPRACGRGYMYDMPTGVCIDIDECEVYNRICGDRRCENFNGSYSCVDDQAAGTETCRPGFYYDKVLKACADLDECRRSRICGQKRCENTLGSYRCIDDNQVNSETCRPGFIYDLRLKSCVDVDECRGNSRICGYQRCENTNGSYRCVDDNQIAPERCRSGFMYDRYLRTCVDIDECRSGRACGRQRCENTVGSYICIDDKAHNAESCRSGYFYDKLLRTCVDIDECQIEIDNCMESVCENTPGSFRCIEQKCYPGYEWVNGTCRDIDECIRLGKNACETNETCGNSKGAYFCQRCVGDKESSRCYGRTQCMPGYEPAQLAHLSCKDIDECKAGFHRCLENEHCVNTIPGYRCDCNPGYTRNRRNQCEIGGDQSRCGIDNVCPDLTKPNPCPGGFQLSRDRLKCEDIDECERNPCLPTEECRNYRGSYRCYVKQV